MPTMIQVVLAGAGGFDGTVNKGEFDVNTDAGITVPDASKGVEVTAIAVNTQDPLFGNHKLEGVFMVLAVDLAAILAGACFVQNFEFDQGHNLFIPKVSTVFNVPAKIFVFASPMGVDDYSKTAIVTYRRVTYLPQIRPG